MTQSHLPSPKAWTAENVGDELRGVFVRYEARIDRAQKERRTAIVRDAEGKLWRVWIFKGSLAWVFDREQPRPGDEIHLVRVRDYTRAPGEVFKTFELKVAKRAARER